MGRLIECPSISVLNAQRKMRVDISSLREFALRALQLCRKMTGQRGGELENLEKIIVVLVSDKRMAALHKKFMNIAGPTDVLTFQHGEIFVSAATARRNARRFKTSTADEIRLYLVHGLLHLQGLEDRTKRGAQKMNSLQKKIIAAAARSL